MAAVRLYLSFPLASALGRCLYCNWVSQKFVCDTVMLARAAEHIIRIFILRLHLMKPSEIIARQILSILGSRYYSIGSAYNTLFNNLVLN